MAPPRMAVGLNPIESIKIPAKGEMKNVIPIERDPIKAAGTNFRFIKSKS